MHACRSTLEDPTAREAGLKLGVYVSPADLYQLRTNPKNPAGFYGNESAKLASTIPTDPASFKTNPGRGRPPPAGAAMFSYEVDDYNRYFLNQLYELLTEYGPIANVWFDGANPNRTVRETYDYAAWYDLIRRLQPNATISVKGPDVRWVGNENGVGRTTEWSVVPLARPPGEFTWPDMTGADLGSRAKLTPGSHLWWYPAEVNAPILNGWFWSARKRPKSAAQLIDIYYTSVGRNGVMLLNLSPDRRGLIPDDQLTSLGVMSQVIDDTFARNLASGARLAADSANPAHGAALALDGSTDTWWEAASGKSTATLTLTLPAAVTFDVVSLQEAIEHRSQRIETFEVATWDGTAWTQVAAETTVGRKRLLRLTTPRTTNQVRLSIGSSRLEPTLTEIGLFKQAIAGLPPHLTDRDASGAVSIAAATGSMTISVGDGAAAATPARQTGDPIVFTTDGTAPTLRSPVYRAPVPLPLGGTIRAASITSEGKLSLIASKTYVGLAPAGWKPISVDGQEAAEATTGAVAVIDGNPATFWESRTPADAALPHSLTIDLGTNTRIGGIAYLPRQDGSPDGVAATYRIETSADGRTWRASVDGGRFANIRNNPIFQEVPFAAVSARYLRFTILEDADARGWASVAELTVLPAAP